ncbi:MAG: dehydrogenase, partial [Actinomycetota bacterium]|nr:dehydrogenase [Actinomycetota bacterium]
LVLGPHGRHLRAACATALPMGAHAADVILARSRGGAAAPFDLGYLMQCVDLGAGRGHVQLVKADDSERPVAVTGRAGGLLKETVCRLTLRWMARAGRYSWPSGPSTDAEGLPTCAVAR